jgi:glycosyltransferase involved in cell wall biosynthesis
MLRVLHCIYDDPRNPWVGGGGSVRIFEMYRRLQGEVDVTVATGNYPGARDEQVEGIRYVRLGLRSPYALSRLSYGLAATRLLAGGEYDVAVFDFSAYTPILVPRGRPVVITVHHLVTPTARERWGSLLGAAVARFERAMLRRARFFTATSGYTDERLRPLLPADVEIARVIAGVPDELFDLPREDRGYLLFFGRLDIFQKGLDTLLAAVARLVRRQPALELRIAGRGKDTERVRQLARDLGIESNVRLLGGVSDAERLELFAGASVLLMPSRFEGFGIVAAEAMAAGIPLVAAAAGSLPEVVRAPEGGILVPPDDPAALAEATASLLDSPERRESLGRSARRIARDYSWSAVAHEHLRFLRHVAAQVRGTHTSSES